MAPLVTHTADAQVAKMPPQVQDLLAAVGPVWGADIGGNIQRTREVYTPLLRAAPKDGVQVTRDLAYGSHPGQQLDLYQPEGGTGVPIVVGEPEVYEFRRGLSAANKNSDCRRSGARKCRNGAQRPIAS